MMELLVVIAVIAILMALLLPGLMSVQRSAKEAAAVAEITQIRTAIANFKATFGVEPPSHITLWVDQAGWDAPGAAEDKATIMRLWPNFDFSNTSYGWSSPVHLSGAECLCFFLGGIQDPGWFVTGFSKDPAHPFKSQSGDTRDGPFLEMKSGPFFETVVGGNKVSGGRLVDRDQDGMLEFCDLFNHGMPYIYVSGREGRGYVNSDAIVFTDTGSPAPNDMARVYLNQSGTAMNSQGYQIICAGADGEYGLGGPYDESLSWATIVSADSTVLPANKQDVITARQRFESDNITNFRNKRLK